MKLQINPPKLYSCTVGPWPMNVYVIKCPITNKCAVIDPGADIGIIMDIVGDAIVSKILLTHGHFDHVGALPELKSITKAPVYINHFDGELFNVKFDENLNHLDTIIIGEQSIEVFHTPGHTPGMVSFNLGDLRIIVGDTLFVGGPGRTNTPVDFLTTMKTMEEIVFIWDDETEFYPGHGSPGTIGIERPDYERFVKRGWQEGLHGDITWK